MTFKGSVALSFILAFVTVLLFAGTGLDSSTAAIIIFLLFVVYMIIFMIVSAKIDVRNSVGFGRYDQEKKILEVKKRVSTNSKKIKIEPVYLAMVKYVPTQVTYTGATVGGVHTGGFSVDEAHYSANQVRKSGKYELKYFVNSNESPYQSIEKISLSQDLVEQARKDDFIKKFLKDDNLVLKYDIKKDSIQSALEKEIVKAPHNLTVLSASANHRKELEALTKEDCDLILKWLCGE